MKQTCTKCFNPDTEFEKYRHFDGKEFLDFSLCRLCSSAFSSFKQEMFLEFMKEDFGKCNISPISKAMIEARKRRNAGKE